MPHRLSKCTCQAIPTLVCRITYCVVPHLGVNRVYTVRAGLLALGNVLEIVNCRVCQLVQMCSDALTGTESLANIPSRVEEETLHSVTGIRAISRHGSVSSGAVAELR